MALTYKPLFRDDENLPINTDSVTPKATPEVEVEEDDELEEILENDEEELE